MVRTLLLFLPLVGSLLLHAPVLRFDLLRGLKRPIDGGRSFRGRRVFGDNKTWRGALEPAVITCSVVGPAAGPVRCVARRRNTDGYSSSSLLATGPPRSACLGHRL